MTQQSMMRNQTSTQMNSLQDLFVDQLRDLYDAEGQIVKALPKMAQAAQASDLKKAFQDHLEQSRTHQQRLERIFSDLGMNTSGQHCEAMEGLLKEGEEALQLQGDPMVKDAALIAAGQRVEHYEMAAYGTVRTFADHLGYNDAEDLLQKTLNEEGQADKLLTSIAEGGLFKSGVNAKATTNTKQATKSR